MERLLITGSNGFFASRFIEYYKHKYDIIAFDHQGLDITDEAKVYEIIKSYTPSFVVNAAAISDTAVCEQNPELSYAVNVTAPVNIAKACYKAAIKMIYLSSDQIYNGNQGYAPYDEITIPKPNTVYGKHKYEAEEKIMQVLDQVVILRLTWLYGFPEINKKTSANILVNVMRAIMKNSPITLPANEYRGITYVNDLIKNFDEIMLLPSGQYNTGSENDLSTYEVGEIILRAMGLENRIDQLLIKDTDSFKNKKRDLRIYAEKLRDKGIAFEDTKRAITRCIKEYSF